MDWTVSPNSKLLYFYFPNNVVIFDPLTDTLTVWLLYRHITDPKQFQTLLKHIENDNTKSRFLRSVLECPPHYNKDELIKSGKDHYSKFLANLITGE